MRPLRFGLLGLGYFGRNYVRLLQGIKGAQLAAVAARTEETLSQFKSSLPASVLKTNDASSVLKNPDIDCVVIATPPSTHLAFAKQALEQGKHVLVEKPMVPSLDDAKTLKAAVSKSGSTFMVGHQYVYNDYIRYLHEAIKGNSLGSVKYVCGEHLGFQVRQDIGCLWDAAPHQLSMLHYLFNPGKIAEVIGSSAAISSSGFDDFAAAAVRFESGLLSTIIVSCSGSQKVRKLTIVGDKKVAVFDDDATKDKLKFFSQSSSNSESIRLSAKEPLLNELEYFIHCINSSEKPLTGISGSYAVIEWLDKISTSIKKHQ